MKEILGEPPLNNPILTGKWGNLVSNVNKLILEYLFIYLKPYNENEN